MSEEKRSSDSVEPGKQTEYQKPRGSVSNHSLQLPSGELQYQSKADWMVLRKDEKPKAEMFYIHYSLNDTDAERRPVTFVFNGGPGASSAYLHIGAAGPKRVDFTDGGMPMAPPYHLRENEESWLSFTDLVFIDPIGTGFSRLIDDDKDKKAEDRKSEKKQVEYWQLKRDLESLGEFMRKFLSLYHRWESPVFIAGESYGGFRVGKLARMAQQEYGIGLSGAILISPALEFSLLDNSDYDVLPWVDTFPVMASAAAVHGKAVKMGKTETEEAYRKRAGEFAIKELLPVLAAGEMYPDAVRSRVLNTAADYIGLPRSVLKNKNGRVSIEYFVKNLLRSQKRVLGFYDSTQTEPDPFPDRDGHEGPDPTLHAIERVFAAGINTQLRKNIGLETDRDYNLLSFEVNQNWKIDTPRHALESQIGATDDLRFGMSLNPDMDVYITHGIYDLVTPYFSTDRLSSLMKLNDDQKRKLTVKHYRGGHMFYAWEESRKAFFSDMKDFYARALAPS